MYAHQPRRPACCGSTNGDAKATNVPLPVARTAARRRSSGDPCVHAAERPNIALPTAPAAADRTCPDEGCNERFTYRVNVPFVSMARPPDPDRRASLLDAATRHVLDQGMANLSLRPLAQAISTSPRMLLYHFGSKEELVTEILAAARLRQAELTAHWLAEQPDLGPAELLRRFWRWQIDEHRPFLRLFFEVYGLALQEPGRFPGFPKDAVADWLPLVAARLEEAGVPDPQARTAATVVIAGYRGLLLDVLATGDAQRGSEGLDFLLDAITFALTPSGQPAPN